MRFNSLVIISQKGPENGNYFCGMGRNFAGRAGFTLGTGNHSGSRSRDSGREYEGKEMEQINLDSCKNTDRAKEVARLIPQKELTELRLETEKRFEDCVESLKTFPHSKGMQRNADYYRKVLALLGDYEEIIIVDLEEGD